MRLALIITCFIATLSLVTVGCVIHSIPEAYYFCTLSVFLLLFYIIISGFLYLDSDGEFRINVCFPVQFGSALRSWFYDYLQVVFSPSFSGVIFVCGASTLLVRDDK